MPRSQAATLLFLAIAIVLFFFSLTLLPAVELYCRFVRPAFALLIVQVVLLALRLRISRESSRPFVIATFVFTILGIASNAVLLITVRGKC